MSDSKTNIVTGKFSFSSKDKKQWSDLYYLQSSLNYPMLYYQRIGLLFVMRTINQLGINFKNNLHLASEINYHHQGIFEENQYYTMEASIKELFHLRKDRVAVVLFFVFYNQNKEKIISSEETLFIKNISEKDIMTLKNQNIFSTHYSPNAFIHLANKHSTLWQQSHTKEVTFTIPSNFAKQYGHIAGDLNFIHISNFAARLFGYKKAFLQGMASCNFIIKYIVESGIKLRTIKVKFHNPVYLGDDVTLYISTNQFELTDKYKKLLVSGHYAINQ
ncbi:MaoC family dehydratase [Cysteiniphilum halobium]|uniref:MaoC family dehydratase n=1 Tax=Cysteiniphilum halobium TaxID=2219059 RepID=UPI003F862BB3